LVCTNFSRDGISFFPEDEVRMWVFEEILPTGKKLSESINEQNVRVRARLLILLLDQQIKWLIYDITLVIMTLNKRRYSYWLQENCKYLPGIKLGKNVIADPDLESAGN
jgi:glycerol-3-phosphate dehydrogenase (NAD+)